jgi:hypothetical protein
MQPVSAAPEQPKSLAGVIGITTGGLNYQRLNGILNVFTLPEFVRDELEMQLIDLNTRWMESFDQAYTRRVRKTAEEKGCYFTNLKVNHKFGNLYSENANERDESMTKAQDLIVCAKTLGCRWVRFPVRKFAAGDDNSKLNAHRALAAFAKPHGIQLLVENGTSTDPDSVARAVKAIVDNVAAGPDTGNWSDDARYEGLSKSFPGAVTCDFKVFDLDEDRHHGKYDIKRCFDIAWQAGFRGPWAIEHWNEDTRAFARETKFLRDQLKQWMAAERAALAR